MCKCPMCDALRGLMILIEKHDLVRNTDHDGDVRAFMRQGMRITAALRAALEALGEK